MTILKPAFLAAVLIASSVASLAQINGLNGVHEGFASLPVLGEGNTLMNNEIISTDLSLSDIELPIDLSLTSPIVGAVGSVVSPIVDLSPLMSLGDGIPIVERLPVVTRVPVLGRIVGDGRGPDPISFVGEILGLERLPLRFVFDGSVPL
ncbi:hypothetical protein [Zhongshania sp.]|uniref:hypothetical protein n=1 Tax=Zhongshania sp. TaxID=1971902 RepID=UPI0035667D71